MKNSLSSTLSRLAVLGLLSAASPASAEDIDLYAGVNGAGGGAPNVLFFIDNTSNWAAQNQQWVYADVVAKCNAQELPERQEACKTYADEIFYGTTGSLPQGRIELRTLKLVLNKTICNNPTSKLRLNVGLMMYARSNAGTADGTSVLGAYIRQRVATLDAAHCAEFIADLDAMDANFNSPDVTVASSADYGTALYEGFKYFGGWTNPAGAVVGKAGSEMISQSDSRTRFGPDRYVDLTGFEDPLAFTNGSKTTYKSPITDDTTCGKNYIILIGNGWPNQEFGTDQNASPPTNSLMTRLGYQPSQIYSVKNKSDIRFADEWAKFLYDTDVSSLAGVQNIRMFSVDVYLKDADAKQGALTKSMADQSGLGGYFAVGGDLWGLINAFTSILTQIASVDSVFASASLPVSVNAQGTFLNQVFMGVFRPDANKLQRWVGNLKQYKFGIDKGSLFLSDADGKLAVDEKNTGFLQHCARSYWTSHSETYWENIPGFDNPNRCLASDGTPFQAFSDSPDGPIVERGGAAQRLRATGHAGRNIRTCTTAACSAVDAFSTTTMSTLSSDLVKWVRGENVGDGSRAIDGSQTWTKYGLDDNLTRPTVHGEVVHSRPLAVNYGISGSNDVVVFYGAGDGMLRAVNGNQGGTEGGNELWAFVAPEHWATLDRVRKNSELVAFPGVDSSMSPKPKIYFFDGSIGGYQKRNKTSISNVWIYPTMRRGGTSVYAFDVTAKPGVAVGSQPQLLWRYSDANNGNMGQSWSTPVVITVPGLSPLVVFGAGYDDCEDKEDANTACASVSKGRGIVVTDAAQGPANATNTRFIDPGSAAGRFVADITPVDVNGDGNADVLYAVDTRGNLWRINTTNPSGFAAWPNGVADWPVNLIATVGQWGASVTERRKLQYAPSVVVLGTQVTVLFGSGDREKPAASSAAAKVRNRFYGIRDEVTVIDPASLPVAIGFGTGSPDLADLKNVTGLTSLDPVSLASYKGWFTELSSTSEPYEQVVTTPLTLAGVTYFSTFRAQGETVDGTSCADLGSGRGYKIDFQTGTRLPNENWATTFVSPGIPPSPVGGLVTIDEKLVPFCIGCAAPSTLSPTKIKPKILPDRKPVYRYQRIDR